MEKYVENKKIPNEQQIIKKFTAPIKERMSGISKSLPPQQRDGRYHRQLEWFNKKMKNFELNIDAILQGMPSVSTDKQKKKYIRKKIWCQ